MTVPPGVVRIGVVVGVPEPHGPVLRAERIATGDPEAHAIAPHITLLGPTDLVAGALDDVDAHLAAVASAHRPFVVQLRGTGTFRPVTPVVFLQLSRGISDCEQLERGIRQGPLSTPVRFPYHPHVTVAHGVPEPVLDEVFDRLSGFEATFVVTGFSRYEQDDDGTWCAVRTFRLRGGAARAGVPQPAAPDARVVRPT
ncbi:2'-5' RNA ligase family protein [Cellulomonas sp. SG140]|uniref:2'-5' RNA ligase family protein n=1 Tax=Cellulomonas sp. SG140 TaxID=2976536 RepID=UPI0021E791BD|nr:2'-5' RNA ligase family protein [Cellulomonas sp. SG140]